MRCLCAIHRLNTVVVDCAMLNAAADRFVGLPASVADMNDVDKVCTRASLARLLVGLASAAGRAPAVFTIRLSLRFPRTHASCLYVSAVYCTLRSPLSLCLSLSLCLCVWSDYCVTYCCHFDVPTLYPAASRPARFSNWFKYRIR